MTDASRERTGLFATLILALLAATVALFVWRGEPIAPWRTIALIAAPFVALGVFLRVRRDTWGRELPYFDLWSFGHLGAGLQLALLGFGLFWVFALAVVWEGIEIVCRVEEYPTNRVSDVIVALAAWPVGRWLFSGDYPLW
jgi:hypothetical protein